MVNVGSAITKATTKLTGNLPRPQFVTWFNEIVSDIKRQPRKWFFLKTTSSVLIANNQITIPSTISEIISIEIGNLFFTQKDQLSDEDAAAIDTYGNTINDGLSQGYTLDPGGIITFHPGQTGTAMVTGEAVITANYADNATTVFPDEFDGLFIDGLRMHFYDAQKDGRFTKESMQYQIDMNNIKAWDNKHKPLPKFSKHGYVRA